MRAEVEVPGYVVGERLGAGGFGEIFAARHAVLGREVAIKILHSKYSENSEAIARFIAEGRAVNKVAHPGIVEIFDFGRLADGRHYCVMERLRGATLRDVLRERTRLTLEEALPILRGIAEAVDAVHAVGIAHRDLKPDNVYILSDGRIKLIDFGLAKLAGDDTAITETGSVFGTPLYMSPEQCRGKATDGATDLYSFGALAYHVLVGAPPFGESDALALALHHLNDQPVAPSAKNPELPTNVDRVVLALMSKDPTRRPQPLVASVESFLETASVPAMSTRRLVVGLSAAIAITLASVVIRQHWKRTSTTPSFSQLSLLPPVSERYTARTIAARPNGAWQTMRVSASAHRVIGADDAGGWELDPDTGDLTRVLVGVTDIARDGTMIGNGDEAQIIVQGPESNAAPVQLATGGSPTFSPDGGSIAFFDNSRHLTVFDRVTKRSRRSERTFGTSDGVTWSPDGTRLTWVTYGEADERARLNIAPATTLDPISIDAPLASDGTLYFGAAFVDDGHLAFCARDHGVSSLMIYAIGTRAFETAHTFLKPVSHCTVSADPSNGRIVLLVDRNLPTLASFDPNHPAPVLDPLGGRDVPSIPSEISADGKFVWSYRGEGVVKDMPAPGFRYPRPRFGEHQLQRIAIATGEATTVGMCQDEIGVLRLGEELLHASFVGSRLVLRSGDCTERYGWDLPVADWGFPRCNKSVCAIERRNGLDIEVWKLTLGAETTLMFKGPVTPAGYAGPLRFLPSIAFSPDGKRLVAMAGAFSNVYVIDLSTGKAITPIEDVATTRYQSVAWGDDPSHFFLSGWVSGAHSRGVHLVGIDGSRKVIWSSLVQWVGRILGAPSSSTLVGMRRDLEQEIVILDPIPKNVGRTHD